MSIKPILLKAYFLMRLPFIMAITALFRARKEKVITKPRNILIIRLDRLGDFVLTLPALENLKSHYPNAKITMLLRPYLQGLARRIDYIDEVVIYNGFFRTLREIRKRNFDIVIDMLYDYKLRPALLAFLSAAPKRIGFSGGFREIFFTNAVFPDTSRRSMTEIDLDIIRAIGASITVKIPHIAWEKTVGKDRNIVIIHPGAYYSSQRWSAEKFADIAQMIERDYDVDIFITGGPGEKNLVEKIAKKINGNNIKVAFPDLENLTTLIVASELLICNNSGPLHLAAALGTPTISTMGPTDPDLWWPQGNNNIVIRKDIECSPCSHGLCLGHKCLESITVDEVFDKVKSILDSRVKRAKK